MPPRPPRPGDATEHDLRGLRHRDVVPNAAAPLVPAPDLFPEMPDTLLLTGTTLAPIRTAIVAAPEVPAR